MNLLPRQIAIGVSLLAALLTGCGSAATVTVTSTTSSTPLSNGSPAATSQSTTTATVSTEVSFSGAVNGKMANPKVQCDANGVDGTPAIDISGTVAGASQADHYGDGLDVTLNAKSGILVKPYSAAQWAWASVVGSSGSVGWNRTATGATFDTDLIPNSGLSSMHITGTVVC